MKTTRLAFGILAGAVVGAAAGVLMAPDKGSATRKMIVRKKDDYVGAMETRLNNLINSVSDGLSFAKSKADRITENGKHQLEEGLAKAGEGLTAAKKRI